MSPVRRYLRISRHTVLETRVYLDDPSLQYSWLLSARDPALPKVIDTVKPMVLPKLLEERERSSWKGKKKKSIKDVVETDDFEVSVFLAETDNRHSVMMKHKHFVDKPRMTSNSSRLLGNAPIEVSSDDEVTLADIPPIERKRGRLDSVESAEDAPPTKRRREGAEEGANENADEGTDEDADEDRKKLAMEVSYQGFAIYGRVLCLVVKRRHARRGAVPATGQAVMENWLSSQAPPGED